MIKCSICKKNIAVVFITKIINGKQIQQGLCISCAKKQGIKPINDILEQTGLSEEDLDKMNSDIMDKMMEGMDIEEMDELGESIGDFADISSRQNDEAKEVKNHLQFKKTGCYGKAFNDCRIRKNCTVRHLCGSKRCRRYCCFCNTHFCSTLCPDYRQETCQRLSKSPYV
jgi:hypothetical protein